jgi:hypothetical protein
MSATGLEVFDTTLHKTNIWLNDLMQIGGWQDRQVAYRALRATLHALRDRLTIDEVAQLSAQLPMLIRGFYYENWDPSSRERSPGCAAVRRRKHSRTAPGGSRGRAAGGQSIACQSACKLRFPSGAYGGLARHTGTMAYELTQSARSKHTKPWVVCNLLHTSYKPQVQSGTSGATHVRPPTLAVRRTHVYSGPREVAR